MWAFPSISLEANPKRAPSKKEITQGYPKGTIRSICAMVKTPLYDLVMVMFIGILIIVSWILASWMTIPVSPKLCCPQIPCSKCNCSWINKLNPTLNQLKNEKTTKEPKGTGQLSKWSTQNHAQNGYIYIYKISAPNSG